MPSFPADILLVASGGAAGAVCRYLLQQSASGLNGKLLCTVAINLAGCLAIGVTWSLISHCNAPLWLNKLLIAGFLGGFTTFSAFAFDTVSLIQDGRAAQAALYAGVSVIAGIILCAIGLKLTDRILGLTS